MRRFKFAGQRQRLTSVHGAVQNLLRIGRHLLGRSPLATPHASVRRLGCGTVSLLSRSRRRRQRPRVQRPRQPDNARSAFSAGICFCGARDYGEKWVGLAVVVLALTSVPTWAQLRAGVAAVEITPKLCDDAAADASRQQFDVRRGCFRWIHLAGFSPYVPLKDNNRLTTGIHDSLWARALAVEGINGETAILVATDLPGLGAKDANYVRRRVERNLGVPFANIIVHSTHTHSAPDVSGYWSTLMPGHNRRYAAQVREWIYTAIRNALSTLQPVAIKVATSTHASCLDPRSRQSKKDPDCRLPDINNQFDNDEDGFDRFLIQRDQRDPITRNTRIVAAEFSSLDGRTVATFVNWHNHPDTLGSSNRLISSDYPHYVRDYLERTRGGIALYFVGTLGNQIGALRGTPVPLWDEGGERVFEVAEADAVGTDYDARSRVLVTEGWSKVRSIGFEIAAAAAAALDTSTAATQAAVEVRTRSFFTPVDNVIHVLGTWSVWHEDVTAEDGLHYSWPRCWGLLGCVRSEVALIRIGELSLITAPGEIDPAYVLGRPASTADYGARWGTWHFPAIEGVDKHVPGDHHAIVGSANDYLSYMIPMSDYVGWWNTEHPNHYEDAVTIGKRFGDDVYRAWLDLLGLPTSGPSTPGH